MIRILLPAVASIILFSCKSTVKDEQGRPVEKVPTIKLQISLNDTMLINEIVTSSDQVMLFYFDPSCDHCKKQTKVIVENLSTLSHVKFYFLTPAQLPEIENFKKLNGVPDNSNIAVGRDIDYSFLNIFKAKSLPFSVVYNKKHQVVAFINGGVEEDQLLPLFKEYKEL